MRKPHRQPGPCPYAHMRMENIMRKSSVRKKSSWFLLVLVAAASLGLGWADEAGRIVSPVDPAARGT